MCPGEQGTPDFTPRSLHVLFTVVSSNVARLASFADKYAPRETWELELSKSRDNSFAFVRACRRLDRLRLPNDDRSLHLSAD